LVVRFWFGFGSVLVQLSEINGFPSFEPYWPEATKDRAAAEMAEFLRMRGNDVRVYPDKLEDSGCFPEQVYLRQ
jgi:hypothetical protein